VARKVYFSFYYDGDIRRVVQVRNSWRFHKGDTQAFLDKADWESIERRGPQAVHSWIDTQMEGTSVTAVLIGARTWTRPYVSYEIKQSHALSKGMLGIRINLVRDPHTGTDTPGVNPLDYHTYLEPAHFGLGYQTYRRVKYSQKYPTYDWVLNDGFNNIEQWIEAAAIAAGR
jgi:hypothetical protein